MGGVEIQYSMPRLISNRRQEKTTSGFMMAVIRLYGCNPKQKQKPGR
jgi:hypothetical protein